MYSGARSKVPSRFNVCKTKVTDSEKTLAVTIPSGNSCMPISLPSSLPIHSSMLLPSSSSSIIPTMISSSSSPSPKSESYRSSIKSEFVGMLRDSINLFSDQSIPIVKNFLWVLGKERWTQKIKRGDVNIQLCNNLLQISGIITKASFPLKLFETDGVGNYRGQKIEVTINDSVKEVMELDIDSSFYVLKLLHPLDASVPDLISIRIQQTLVDS